MPARLCPKCGKAGQFLPATSETAVVDYYRCPACAHVWCVDRHNPTAPIRHVTIRDEKKGA